MVSTFIWLGETSWAVPSGWKMMSSRSATGASGPGSGSGSGSDFPSCVTMTVVSAFPPAFAYSGALRTSSVGLASARTVMTVCPSLPEAGLAWNQSTTCASCQSQLAVRVKVCVLSSAEKEREGESLSIRSVFSGAGSSAGFSAQAASAKSTESVVEILKQAFMGFVVIRDKCTESSFQIQFRGFFTDKTRCRSGSCRLVSSVFTFEEG